MGVLFCGLCAVLQPVLRAEHCCVLEAVECYGLCGCLRASKVTRRTDAALVLFESQLWCSSGVV